MRKVKHPVTGINIRRWSEQGVPILTLLYVYYKFKRYERLFKAIQDGYITYRTASKLADIWLKSENQKTSVVTVFMQHKEQTT